MVLIMKENEILKAKNMGKEFNFEKMEANMKDDSKMINLTEKEDSFKLMVIYTMVNE